MEKVGDTYPGCLQMDDFENMMVCLKKYEFELLTPFDSKSNIIDTGFMSKTQNEAQSKQPCWQSTQLQLCLIVKELRIVCFDKVSPNQLIPR